MLFESRILLASIEAHYNFVTLTTQEENPLDAAIAARIVSPSASIDADQRIVGSWHEIGTQYSPGFPEYVAEKRDYNYSPFEHGLKVHGQFEQS